MAHIARPHRHSRSPVDQSSRTRVPSLPLSISSFYPTYLVRALFNELIARSASESANYKKKRRKRRKWYKTARSLWDMPLRRGERAKALPSAHENWMGHTTRTNEGTIANSLTRSFLRSSFSSTSRLMTRGPTSRSILPSFLIFTLSLPRKTPWNAMERTKMPCTILKYRTWRKKVVHLPDHIPVQGEKGLTLKKEVG